jgi:hypothetical protein
LAVDLKSILSGFPAQELAFDTQEKEQEIA